MFNGFDIEIMWIVVQLKLSLNPGGYLFRIYQPITTAKFLFRAFILLTKSALSSYYGDFECLVLVFYF